MFANYYGLFIFLITFISLNALSCNNLALVGDKDTPCFLESSSADPLLLITSGNSLVLPCHVARSKRATVEWWYTDVQNTVTKQIYAVYPPVRPTVVRFVTSLTTNSLNSNETDIVDASILLRHINVDDSGLYRCVIRPWPTDPFEQFESVPLTLDTNVESLNYQVQSKAPRFCQSNPSVLPCFTAMRTSSPTVIDAYQTAFLQCVVKSHNRPINVFWVVGDSAENSILITDYLTNNHHKGDRLRRVFPLSLFDHSIELSVNRTLPERVYSCVISGATEPETTLFTYIVRTIDLEEVNHKASNASHSQENIPAHDVLTHDQIHSLRENQKYSEESASEERKHQTEDEEEPEKQEQSEETSTTI